jgi:NADH-quinone oxidoreductase subunit E
MALSTEDREFLDTVLKESSSLESPILFLLHRLQERYRMIGSQHVKYISKKLDRPFSEIYSAATFYDEFTLEPTGEYVIRICRGISCHSRDSLKLFNAIKNKFGIEDGETTEDGRISIDGSSCIGQCDGAPAMMINDDVYRNLDVEKALEIIDEILNKGGD